MTAREGIDVGAGVRMGEVEGRRLSLASLWIETLRQKCPPSHHPLPRGMREEVGAVREVMCVGVGGVSRSGGGRYRRMSVWVACARIFLGFER